jgi:hypothetical protein
MTPKNAPMNIDNTVIEEEKKTMTVLSTLIQNSYAVCMTYDRLTKNS